MAGDTYPSLKVAAVQASPIFLDRAATVEKACRLIEQAGDEGARVVVFPECFIAGYPHWYNFHVALDATCRRFNVELFRNAIEIGGEDTRRLGEAARRAKAHVVIGINERPAGSYGTLYNTLLFLGPDGEVAGRHRKLVPTLGERLVFAGGDGSGLPVVRYSPDALADELGSAFTLVHSEAHSHRTPSGALQAFQYSSFTHRPFAVHGGGVAS